MDSSFTLFLELNAQLRYPIKAMRTPKYISNIILYTTFPLLLFGWSVYPQVLFDSVIAVVNKRPITQSELVNEFRIEVIMGKPLSQEPTNAAKQAYLDRIINRKLVVQAAERIGITANAQKKKVNERITEMRVKFLTDTAFHQVLQKQEIEIESLEKWISDQSIYDEYYTRQFVRTIDSKEIDELAPQYFEANKAQFVVPATVTFRSALIVVKPNSSENEKQNANSLAEQIFARLQQGETFHFVKESLNTKKSIRFNTLTQTTDTPLGAIVANMQPDEVKGPIHDAEGYRVVEFVKKTAKRQKQYSEVKTEIANLIRQNRAKTGFKKWLTKQKSNVSWYILNNALGRISGITIQTPN